MSQVKSDQFENKLKPLYYRSDEVTEEVLASHVDKVEQLIQVKKWIFLEYSPIQE